MKKILLGVCAVILIGTGCSSNTYSNQRKAEDKLIANYIAREGIQILNTLPDDDYVWGEKEYYQVSGYDNMYFHLIKRGPATTISGTDTIDNLINSSETIILRYKQYALTENADTANYWNTLDNAYPREFKYLTDYTNACTGWHVAVSLMKYPGSECQLICPSKQGFTEDQNSVTPYGYIMRIQVKPW